MTTKKLDWILVALAKKTKERMALALGMAGYMRGGPSLMYPANAVAAFEQFSAA